MRSLPKLTRVLFPTLLVLSALVLAGPTPEVAAQKKGGVLKIGNLGEPPSLDPHWGTQTITEVLTNHVYEGLYSLDASYRPDPHAGRGPARGARATGSRTRSSSARASSSTTARR